VLAGSVGSDVYGGGAPASGALIPVGRHLDRAARNFFNQRSINTARSCYAIGGEVGLFAARLYSKPVFSRNVIKLYTDIFHFLFGNLPDQIRFDPFVPVDEANDHAFGVLVQFLAEARKMPGMGVDIDRIVQ